MLQGYNVKNLGIFNHFDIIMAIYPFMVIINNIMFKILILPKLNNKVCDNYTYFSGVLQKITFSNFFKYQETGRKKEKCEIYSNFINIALHILY